MPILPRRAGSAGHARPEEGTPRLCRRAILAYGFPANHALAALDELAPSGLSVAVYDARFAKPIDLELTRSLLEERLPILTVEAGIAQAVQAIVTSLRACAAFPQIE